MIWYHFYCAHESNASLNSFPSSSCWVSWVAPMTVWFGLISGAGVHKICVTSLSTLWKNNNVHHFISFLFWHLNWRLSWHYSRALVSAAPVLRRPCCLPKSSKVQFFSSSVNIGLWIPHIQEKKWVSICLISSSARAEKESRNTIIILHSPPSSVLSFPIHFWVRLIFDMKFPICLLFLTYTTPASALVLFV